MFGLFFISNIQAAAIFILVFLLCYYYFGDEERGPGKLPPGPPNLPFVGSLPYLGADVREPLLKLTDKYGDMFTVYLGSMRVVMLNSYEAVKDAFVKNGNVFAGRPSELFFIKEITKGRGIISSQGDLWQQQRKFMHSQLRKFGVGSSVLEDKVKEELRHLIVALKSKAGTPHDLHYQIQASVGNIIFSLLYGRRFEYEDPKFVNYMDIMNLGFEVSGNSGAATAFPILLKLPFDPFRIKEVLRIGKYMEDEHMDGINEKQKHPLPDEDRDLVDAYLREINKNGSNENSTFTMEQLIAVIGDLFGAGTETTTTTMLWAMIHMMHRPDIQEKVHQEIDDIIGSERLPSMKDKPNMPLTNAVILEVHRVSTIVPLGVPHATLEDVQFRGYNLPKGTQVMSNIYAVHRDPSVWEEADIFKPERFIDDDGKLHRSEKVIPFSMGKRVCLGESMAIMEAFLFFTTLMQGFRFTNPPDQPLPSLKGKMTATNFPPHFNVLLESRH